MSDDHRYAILEFHLDLRSVFDKLRLIRKNEPRSLQDLYSKWTNNRSGLTRIGYYIRILNLIEEMGPERSWDPVYNLMISGGKWEVDPRDE